MVMVHHSVAQTCRNECDYLLHGWVGICTCIIKKKREAIKQKHLQGVHIRAKHLAALHFIIELSLNFHSISYRNLDITPMSYLLLLIKRRH